MKSIICSSVIFLVFLVGCSPVRVVEDIPNKGECLELSVVDADGVDEKEIRASLKSKARRLGGNLLVFIPDQPYQVTLIHPLTRKSKPFNGVGTVYKCASQ